MLLLPNLNMAPAL